MFGWRLIPDDMLEVIKGENKELRNQVEGLLDRLLLGQGHLPIQPEFKKEVTASTARMVDELSELTLEETTDEGVDSKAGGK